MIRHVSMKFSTVQNNASGNESIKKTQQNQHISRVEEIKKEIQNGTYKIDLQKTAEAMAKALLF